MPAETPPGSENVPLAAFAAAGTATAVICTLCGLSGGVAGAASLAHEGQMLTGILMSPFVGAGLAVISGVLAFLPALTWSLCALLVAPRILPGRNDGLRGALVGLICSGPALPVALALSRAHPLGDTLDLGMVMSLASLVGGIAAGVILSRLLRRIEEDEAEAAPTAPLPAA